MWDVGKIPGSGSTRTGLRDALERRSPRAGAPPHDEGTEVVVAKAAVNKPAKGGGPAPAEATRASFPSAAIRPIPGFEFDVPGGFVLGEAAGAIAAVRSEEASDGFYDNVLIRHMRVARGATLPAAGRAAIERVRRQARDVVVGAERIGRFNGQPEAQQTYLCSLELTVPQTERRLSQGHALVFAPGGGTPTADLFHLVGTCAAEHADDFGQAFVQLLTSLRFT